MPIYRVGGAVRDMLLGLEPKDHDFVVVGQTVEQFVKTWSHRMEVQQVGKAFPVFIVEDQDSGWKGEFAFARRERKVGVGHNAFAVEADPSVTLEEDLSRRDLTVNAIALPVNYRNNPPLESQVIDPFGGVSDLKLGVLRHVGPAFAEDPLRVFRLARFAAKLGFVVDVDTYRLVRGIPDEEILALSAERVGEEFMRAMAGAQPVAFVTVLERCRKLHLWLPELARLREVPAGPPEHHREGDALNHSLMVLNALDPCAPVLTRVAALFHDLGKGVTPKEKWPAHHGHDEAGVALVEAACDRLRLPATVKAAAVTACREHMRVHVFMEMRKGKMADLVRAADRSSLGPGGLAAVCLADANGRVPPGDSEGARALLCAAAAAQAEPGHPIPAGLQGENIGLHIRAQKGNAIRRALKAQGFLGKG